MQLFAVNFISLQGHSTCFGCFPHPSSGVQFHLYLQPEFLAADIEVSGSIPGATRFF